VLHLAQLAWIEERGNVCFLGPPGTGKTHLAIALGLKACERGYRVAFATAQEWVSGLEAAQDRNQLEQELIGLGILIGDGQLPNPSLEEIIEAFDGVMVAEPAARLIARSKVYGRTTPCQRVRRQTSCSPCTTSSSADCDQSSPWSWMCAPTHGGEG